MPSFLGGIFLDLGRRRGEFTRVRLASVTAYYSHSRGRHNAVAAEAAPQARQSPGRPVVPVNATIELRAAILGYGPNSGDDSGRVVIQPRALATRTRSL